MSGLEPLAIAAVVGGSALSATSQVISAQEKSTAAEFESQQYKIQQQAAQTASSQDEAARRRELTSNIEAVQALRAGRGVGSESPTGMAILSSTINQSEADIAASKANYATKADLAGRASQLSQRKASTSLLAGYLGAGATAAEGIYKGYSVGRGK